MTASELLVRMVWREARHHADGSDLTGICIALAADLDVAPEWSEVRGAVLAALESCSREITRDGAPGDIRGVWTYDDHQTEYRVSWWHNGAETRWMEC